jgi:hypothetical protein
MRQLVFLYQGHKRDGVTTKRIAMGGLLQERLPQPVKARCALWLCARRGSCPRAASWEGKGIGGLPQ